MSSTLALNPTDAREKGPADLSSPEHSARSSEPGEPGGDRRLALPDSELAGWTLAAVVVVLAGLQVWSGSVRVPWTLPLSLAIEATGLACVALTWTLRRFPRAAQLALLGAALAGVAARSYLAVIGNPGYGTDELAFDQYAATLVLHGIDPYLRSMAPSLTIFHVPDIFQTYTLTGRPVTALSYPAGSFLAYLPGLAFGWHTQEATAVDVLAWLVTSLLVWRLLPRPLKWSAIVLSVAAVYFDYAVGGVTDTLYLPFLAVALYRWDRFSAVGGWRRWCAPVALGLACSIKQTPWFLVPLLVTGIALEARWAGRPWHREAATYVGLVAAPLALLDLPFAVMGPLRWLGDVLTPLTAPTVPGGQGIVGLTMLAHLGGQLKWYSLAGALALLLTWSAWLGWYSTLKRALVVLVPMVFFLPTRSFGSYLVEMLPLVVLAATTVSGAPVTGLRPLRWAAVPLAAGAAGAVALGALVPPPLSLRVEAMTSTGQLQSIDRLRLLVRNRTSAPLSPRYTIMASGQQSSFWRVARGDSRIPAHSSAVVNLEAPDAQSMPSLQGAFIVDAFTSSPATLSTTTNVQTNPLSTVLEPESIDKPVPVGTTLSLTVQLVNAVGSPVRQAGVPVSLGQVVYGQSAIVPGESSIDGLPEGHSPVTRRTDAAGIATFTVRGVQAQGSPVFFQAWRVTGAIPNGYSDLLSVQFVPRPARPAPRKPGASRH